MDLVKMVLLITVWCKLNLDRDGASAYVEEIEFKQSIAEPSRETIRLWPTGRMARPPVKPGKTAFPEWVTPGLPRDPRQQVPSVR
jgi:hypothetical protein